ncbi:MAG TPA: hypothetical protein VHE30_26245 [Polyangiaceae bacterium]|nr:hypothetical protein [Polyangiaceae bacterium]
MNESLEQDLWHVEVASGEVKVVTLDQLDEAFQQGLVNEGTRVWQEGMPAAMTLAELLGGGEDESEGTSEESEPEAPALERYQPEPQPTLIGLPLNSPVLDEAPIPASLRPEPAPAVRAAPASASEPPAARASMWPPPNGAAPPVSVAQSRGPRVQAASEWPPVVTRAAPPAQAQPPSSPPPSFRRPQVAETGSAWPPVVTRSTPPASSSPDSLRPVMAPSVPPPSLASNALPMTFDLDDAPFAKKSGKGKVFGIGVTLLAAAAGVAFAVNGGALPGDAPPSAVAAAAVAPTVAPEPPKSHAYDPGSTPVHLSDAPPPVVITTRQNEEKNLADAIGKKLGVSGKAAAAPKAAPKTAVRSTHRTGNTSAGAFKGRGKGSTYDPLNGAL